MYAFFTRLADFLPWRYKKKVLFMFEYREYTCYKQKRRAAKNILIPLYMREANCSVGKQQSVIRRFSYIAALVGENTVSQADERGYPHPRAEDGRHKGDVKTLFS